MIEDYTPDLHSLIASGHLHAARDVASRQIAEIERGMRDGEAVDACGQARGGVCVHKMMVQNEGSLWRADD